MVDLRIDVRGVIFILSNLNSIYEKLKDYLKLKNMYKKGMFVIIFQLFQMIIVFEFLSGTYVFLSISRKIR